MRGVYERRWRFKETELLIKSDHEQAIESAIGGALEARGGIESAIVNHPEFRNSLEPISLSSEEESRVVDLMLRASEIAEIGPLASVAGSISQVSAEVGMAGGASNILVDNGGDISIVGDRNFRVGVYAGNARPSGKIALLVKEKDLPIGICTSSGSVGHSMSFGDSDAVVVFADEASVADASATAIANEVGGCDIEYSIKRGLDRADDISEISGCLIIREDRIGVVGSLPEILGIRKETKIRPSVLEASSPFLVE